MKKLAIIFLYALIIFSCDQQKDPVYTTNELTYNLYQGSDFNYTGKVQIKELLNGDLELTLELNGNKDTSPYYFPAHLHFGPYDSPDSPIAFQLDPIDIRTLKSVTVLGQLSDGTKLKFEDLSNFDGHIKVHLADSGPEYQVILSVGNIGANDNSSQAFKKEDMTVCSPYLN
ncbi:hypothetical protein [Aquiflexum gelatinilyticum]|uniref:CHRD domain-containing protein n=1 Tax=Aquiflexum gelatinilyticum TaxID=2961943 RepID=A0A9X2PBQ6_9BACT|nr:hypothetical protein [Aquiflexum gelatinilyticum]MCR9016664.1 hypothetical protein [Aquiflexum gelatinilyticum]